MHSNAISEKTIQKNGFQFHLVPTFKFKTIHIVVKFKELLRKDTITKRALLPYVLRQGTDRYPTERKLQQKLDHLYGANLSIDGTKKGNHHILSFRLELANDKFIENEQFLLDDALHFLKEVIYKPNHYRSKSFHKKIFEREKETLRQRIHSIVDDKMAYANMRLIDEMCKNESYALRVHGYVEDLDTITAEDLYTYYEKVLAENDADIYILGDVDEEIVLEKVQSIFNRDEDFQYEEIIVEEDVPVRKTFQEIVETQDLKQAKLHIGYRTNTVFRDKDYYALQVFNGLYGGFPSSKLFLNVREKNSLAYYVASNIESHKGLMFVYSGIANDDYEKARTIIEQQMEEMRQGNFTEEEMEETKSLIINQLKETCDHPQGIIELLYQQVVGKRSITVEEMLERIRTVTKEEVINVAQKIQEDTVYLLTSEEGHVND